MGNFKEYQKYDALGLAELIKKKEVSPLELCEAAIERIELLNPKLNAVIYRMYDEARESIKSKLPKGRFSGVPFLLKDLQAAYKGVPMTRGSKAYKNFIPDYDSELVTRFKSAGLVILGKTNTPEFGLMGTTEPKLHGPTLNPWNTAHSTGGSSGGTAAAVASGMTPVASGGDGGGSIRIPASCCGIFGLKPSRGRNPSGPKSGRLWQDAVVEHILSRSVRDSAAMLDATHGPDIGAPYCIQPPERSYLSEIKKKPGKLTIAVNTKSPVGAEVHPECVRAVDKAARLLEDLGHTVEEAQPDIDGIELAKSYFLMYCGEVAAEVTSLRDVLGRKARRSDVELGTWFLNYMGHVYTAGDFAKVTNVMDTAARIMGNFHQTYDLYLTPTIAIPPAKIGELMPQFADKLGMVITLLLRIGTLAKMTGTVTQIALSTIAKTPFTQLANFTGQPAMSIPLHWTPEGLPVGVQFIGPYGDEATLFRLAAQLEKAQPWFDRHPEIF